MVSDVTFVDYGFILDQANIIKNNIKFLISQKRNLEFRGTLQSGTENEIITNIDEEIITNIDEEIRKEIDKIRELRKLYPEAFI